MPGERAIRDAHGLALCADPCGKLVPALPHLVAARMPAVCLDGALGITALCCNADALGRFGDSKISIAGGARPRKSNRRRRRNSRLATGRGAKTNFKVKTKFCGEDEFQGDDEILHEDEFLSEDEILQRGVRRRNSKGGRNFSVQVKFRLPRRVSPWGWVKTVLPDEDEIPG